MDLYSRQSKSIPQKVIIVAVELFLLYFSYWILFKDGGTVLLDKLGIDAIPGNFNSRLIIFLFSVIIFLRITFTLFYLLKRKIPWEESFSIPIAFALYYIGFALIGCQRNSTLAWRDVLAVLIFLTG